MDIFDIFKKHLKNFVEEVKGEMDKEQPDKELNVEDLKTEILEKQEIIEVEDQPVPEETIPEQNINNEPVSDSNLEEPLPVAKKRGRPSKAVESSDEEVEKTSKKRGRPKKTEEIQLNKPKKKRGRPAKPKTEEVEQNKSEKKRGRPKKNIENKVEPLEETNIKAEELENIIPSADQTSSQSEENVEDKNVSTETASETVKKRRGRPSKKKEVEVTDDSNEFQYINPPKRRGRPKKQPVSNPIEEEAIIGIDQEEPVKEDKKPNVKKSAEKLESISNYSSAAEIRAVLVNSETKKKGRPKGSKNKSRFTY